MYHGGSYRHSSNIDPFQALLMLAVSIGSIFVIVIISIIIKSFIANKKSEREKKVINIAKRTGANYKPIFSKPVKDGATMECFICFNDPSYINVIEKADKENGVIYIGELEWVKPLSPHGNSRRSRNSYDYNAGARMGTDSNFDRIKHYNTMCVLYDNAFNLPNFDLTKETIDKKATEFLKMNETEDIDFDEDKEFSEAWWLTSNDNMIVKQLFTYNIRKNFMKFVDKGYRISGQQNMLIIITDKVIQPENYPSITSDIKVIARFLRTNKKFYKPEVTEENKDSDNESQSEKEEKPEPQSDSNPV